jgi:transcriptional regulator with XRE-family HTH domain
VARPQPAKAILVDRGLRQNQVAPAVGVQPVTLCQVLNRERKAWPALRARLADYLDVPEDQLFNDGYGAA